ncbi:NAD-dependent epimerase/dehydratase family protein [Planctomycetota bacterium]
MSETYLVTGGAGFIGSHTARRLLDAGNEVVVADSLLTGDRDNVPEGATFVEMDLADESLYSKLDGVKPKAIIHLAGQSSGEISFESPSKDLDINTRATILLGEWARKQGCNRILFSSSVSVYGDGKAPGAAMSEEDDPSPKSFYGCSKLASEHYLKVFQSEYGINGTSFRLFNVYGPGQNMKNMKQGMVSIYLSFVLFQESLLVKGAMDRYRDLVYVSDVVDILVGSIDDERSFGGVFNVGTGRKTTVGELVQRILEATGKPDFPVEEGEGTPGDSFGSLADVSHVKDALGWEAEVSLDRGLQEMVAACR